MSGIELLPFVWALPVAYIAASYGKPPREQEEEEQQQQQQQQQKQEEEFAFSPIQSLLSWSTRGDPELISGLTLDGELSSRFHSQHERNQDHDRIHEIIVEESIELCLGGKGCTSCFLA